MKVFCYILPVVEFGPQQARASCPQNGNRRGSGEAAVTGKGGRYSIHKTLRFAIADGTSSGKKVIWSKNVDGDFKQNRFDVSNDTWNPAQPQVRS